MRRRIRFQGSNRLAYAFDPYVNGVARGAAHLATTLTRRHPPDPACNSATHTLRVGSSWAHLGLSRTLREEHIAGLHIIVHNPNQALITQEEFEHLAHIQASIWQLALIRAITFVLCLTLLPGLLLLTALAVVAHAPLVTLALTLFALGEPALVWHLTKSDHFLYAKAWSTYRYWRTLPRHLLQTSPHFPQAFDSLKPKGQWAHWVFHHTTPENRQRLSKSVLAQYLASQDTTTRHLAFRALRP